MRTSDPQREYKGWLCKAHVLGAKLDMLRETLIVVKLVRDPTKSILAGSAPIFLVFDAVAFIRDTLVVTIIARLVEIASHSQPLTKTSRT